MKEWICQEEPLICADGASVGVGFRQMVELVRCKDCKISKLEKVYKNVPRSKEKVRWCELMQRYVDDDWFCADGERKE